MRRRSGGGSGGGAGYRFQSQVIAFVDAHIMSKHPLGWLDTLDVPVAVGAETGGPGDDVCVFLQGSPRKIEVQAKGGLSADRRFYETLDRFFTGLMCDSSLRLILAVDPRASKPIRQDLRHDLNRLRQGRTDGLRQFTEKVLAYLGSHGAPEPAMLARHLYVVVIGMEDDAPWSKRDAIDLLEHDLNEPEQAAAAWELLVADGLTLIKERGQRDAVSLIGLLNSKQIRVSATHDGAQIHAYTHWLKDVTATFHIPGLGVALSINDAWIHLQAAQSAAQVTGSQAQSLESKLASYHEWERLSYRETAYMALDIAELDRHAIIIGGPGSGKSTLCQRVAHQLAASGERVLWVRLPLVLRRMQSYGESIDEALVHEATSGFRSPDKAVHRLLNDPVCLLADGLDECDPQREFIAGELRRWATSRVESRIVVTSRPIGHDPALFPNWMHAELLPLASDHIKADVERIIAASITNQTDARKKAARFESELRRNNVASVAARSPLLLGFLVQLFLNGVALPHGRADLYDHVLELWRQAPSRIGLSQTSQLDAVIARRSLEIIGWLLHTATAEQGSRSRRSLVSQLAGHLSTGPGTPYLVAETRASECLSYWEERGVLKRLQIGPDDAFTFIHLSLGEYVTGCYISRLDDHEIRELVTRFRRDPRWREPLLLSAGAGATTAIVEQLLQLDDVLNPVATESLLAAAALAEETLPKADLAQLVAEHIATRLASPIPLIAHECVDNALGLAAQASNLMAQMLKPLLRHPQAWTRLAAMRLALATEDEALDLDALEACIDEGSPPQFEPVLGGLRGLMISKPKMMWNDVIAYGVKRLASERPTLATIECTTRLPA